MIPNEKNLEAFFSLVLILISLMEFLLVSPFTQTFFFNVFINLMLPILNFEVYQRLHASTSKNHCFSPVNLWFHFFLIHRFLTLKWLSSRFRSFFQVYLSYSIHILEANFIIYHILGTIFGFPVYSIGLTMCQIHTILINTVLIKILYIMSEYLAVTLHFSTFSEFFYQKDRIIFSYRNFY